MSTTTRQFVVDNLLIRPNTPHASDLLDPKITSTYLIAALERLIRMGYHIELTCVCSDHHDDGPRGHTGGKAVDAWINTKHELYAWADADSHLLRQFLVDFADDPHCFQIGVSGDAIAGTAKGGPHNYDYFLFSENAPEHLHLGIHD